MTDLKEVEAIISESGNSFHSKVANHLKDKDWNILVSPYYMDNASNKPREIDLIAEKAWPYSIPWEHKQGTINIKLFIECKYIPQKNVFWFAHKDMSSARKWVISNTTLPENSSFIDQHHYLASNPKVAKLFASKTKANTENEVIYKALNQSLNAMVYLRNGESIIQPQRGRRKNILKTVEHPVILCNSFENFYQVDMEDASNPEQITDNFQLEVNYAYISNQGKHKSEYFLLDILDFSKLDKFLAVLEVDVQAFIQCLD